MTRLFQALAVIALLIAPASPSRAQGEAPSPAVQGAIVAVIEAQLEAFQRDDGNAAFSHASPTIRAKFGSATSFMAMVRSGYGAVYRPQEVRFLDARVIEGRTGQAVRVVGPDGRAQVVIYWMEQQPDGSWKINGVQLVPLDESYS